MSDDLLELATRALRENSDGPALRAGATRARLLASAELRYGSRRRPWLRMSVVFAGLFLTGTAMAAQLSGGLRELVRVLTPAAWSAPEVLPARPHVRHVPKVVQPSTSAASQAPAQAPSSLEIVEPTPSSQRTVPTASASQVAVTPAPTSRSAELAPDAAARRFPARKASRARARTLQDAQATSSRDALPAQTDNIATPARASDQVQPEPGGAVRGPSTTGRVAAAPTQLDPSAQARALALFRKAQALHERRDPAALAAWDAYLRAAPTGALAPEARYNRALSLVRAHRFDAARLALEPFAQGAEGHYRQREARALLEQLPRE